MLLDLGILLYLGFLGLLLHQAKAPLEHPGLRDPVGQFGNFTVGRTAEAVLHGQAVDPFGLLQVMGVLGACQPPVSRARLDGGESPGPMFMGDGFDRCRTGILPRL